MPADPSNTTEPTEVTVPVINESIHVEKLTRDTETVRVTTHVEAETVLVDAPRVVETIEVERRAIGRPVDGPIGMRTEGDTTIISVVEEIVVVEKRFVLKEEVRVTKRRSEETLRAEVTLRREVAHVERTAFPDETDDVSTREI